MKKRQGFTLVELLVVMAIISILAAIVVPNVQRYIVRARVTKAVSEINGIELAMTAMLTDAGRGNLAQLFIAGAVPKAVGWNMPEGSNTADQWPAWITDAFNFAEVTKIYTNVVYDLLRLGRTVLTENPAYGPNGVPIISLVPREVIAKLGTNYMDLGTDPWGQDYNIFPGPWRVASDPSNTSNRYPIMFRKFTVESEGSQRGARNDGFAIPVTTDDGVVNDTFLNAFGDVVLDPEAWPKMVGYPADSNKSLYVWSTGANMRSGQMLYQAAYTAGDPRSWYGVQEDADIGGGDDINNWDPGTSWQRFYN